MQGPDGMRASGFRGGAHAAISLLAAVLFLTGLSGESLGVEISGERDFAGEVVLPEKETWTVLPGTTLRFRGGGMIVRGRLIVEGTEEQPVRIKAGDNFAGIDIRGVGNAVFSHARIEGGRIGVQVTGATAVFRTVRWERNGIGLVVNQHATVNVEDSSFISPLRVGVLVKRGGRAEIGRTSFSGAGKAGIFAYGADNVTVRESRFRANETGILASMRGARPVVERCTFEENGTGIFAEKMAEPHVRESEIFRNRTGLHFSRRAEGTVFGSRILHNDDGVLIERSSYPVFRGNRFRENRDKAVRLRNQSSVWEEELGEADREIPEGFAPFGATTGGRRDFTPGGAAMPPGGPPGPKEGLDGTVDFRGNHWGEDDAEASQGGNVASIHDGMDEPEFPYKGKMYRMDRVRLR